MCLLLFPYDFVDLRVFSNVAGMPTVTGLMGARRPDLGWVSDSSCVPYASRITWMAFGMRTVRRVTELPAGVGLGSWLMLLLNIVCGDHRLSEVGIG